MSSPWRPDEAKVRARAYQLWERSGGGVRTREEDEANYFEALRQVENEERAHRIWQQRGGDAVANYFEAERQIAEERKPVTFANGFPPAQRALVEQAWDILKTVAAGAGTEQEIARVAVITRLPGVHLRHLATPMLERIAATPKTSLVVLADRGPIRDPAPAGSTTLFAEYDGTKKHDTGLYSNRAEFEALLAGIRKGERRQVKFTIQIKVLVPYNPYFYAEARVSLPDYVETLAHEIALHGEKYVEQITAWQDSDDVQWKPTYEDAEHAEHMFCGNPRYLLLLGRLYERGDHPPGLLAGVEAELRHSKRVYSKLDPPVEAGDRAMLDWLELIKRQHQ